MALVVFGEKVDMLNIPSPEPGGFLVAYDLDGILKQKDENGLISDIGGGGIGTLSQVLLSGNNSGTSPIVLDSSIISGTNKISLDNSAVSITTDNSFYGESYLFMTSESLLLGNSSKSFRIEKDIYNQYDIITRYDVSNEQIIKNNSYQLKLNDKPVLEFTSGTTSIGGSRLSSLISSDGSTIITGIVNTVVLGGLGINANQSNSVYVPDLYIQDTKSIKGTRGSGKIQFDQYNNVTLSNSNNILGILSSTSSVTLSSNGILVRDTLNSTSSPNINAGVSYISTKNSSSNSGVLNTVIIGGQGLSATESNTVYLGNTVNINNKYKLPNIDGSNGQVLKTDGIGNVSWSSVSGVGDVHYIGEYFDGGIIFHLYTGIDGLQHGLIVAPTCGVNLNWSNFFSNIATTTDDGLINTNLIKAKIADNLITSQAIDYILTLGTGWYLPSIDELVLLAVNRKNVQESLRINNMSKIEYDNALASHWSSSNNTSGFSSSAFFFNMHLFTIGSTLKTSTLTVRAIKSF